MADSLEDILGLDDLDSDNNKKENNSSSNNSSSDDTPDNLFGDDFGDVGGAPPPDDGGIDDDMGNLMSDSSQSQGGKMGGQPQMQQGMGGEQGLGLGGEGTDMSNNMVFASGRQAYENAANVSQGIEDKLINEIKNQSFKEQMIDFINKNKDVYSKLNLFGYLNVGMFFLAMFVVIIYVIKFAYFIFNYLYVNLYILFDYGELISKLIIALIFLGFMWLFSQIKINKSIFLQKVYNYSFFIYMIMVVAFLYGTITINALYYAIAFIIVLLFIGNFLLVDEITYMKIKKYFDKIKVENVNRHTEIEQIESAIKQEAEREEKEIGELVTSVDGETVEVISMFDNLIKLKQENEGVEFMFVVKGEKKVIMYKTAELELPDIDMLYE